MRLPKEKHRRKTVQQDRTSPDVAVGEPWLREGIRQFAQTNAKLGIGRRIYLLVLVAWTCAAMGLLFGKYRGEAFKFAYAYTFIAVAVMLIVPAGLADLYAYLYARSVIQGLYIGIRTLITCTTWVILNPQEAG